MRIILVPEVDELPLYVKVGSFICFERMHPVQLFHLCTTKRV
jgi:hypothetical protein